MPPFDTPMTAMRSGLKRSSRLSHLEARDRVVAELPAGDETLSRTSYDMRDVKLSTTRAAMPAAARALAYGSRGST